MALELGLGLLGGGILVGSKIMGSSIENATVDATRAATEAATIAASAAEHLRETLEPLVGVAIDLSEPGARLINWAAVLSAGMAFSQTVTGICTVVNTYNGSAAQGKLSKFSHASMDDSMDVLVNHKAQHEFPDHVYKYVLMRSQQESARPTCFFLYHKGSEWHSEFHDLNHKNPISNFCGFFSELDILAAYLITLRQFVGPTPTFRILIPSASLFLVDDAIAMPESVGKLVMEGELCNQTGEPYVHVNMPGAPADMFVNVRNMAAQEAPKAKGYDVRVQQASNVQSWGSWVVSTSASLVVGLLCMVLLMLVVDISGRGDGGENSVEHG